MSEHAKIYDDEAPTRLVSWSQKIDVPSTFEELRSSVKLQLLAEGASASRSDYVMDLVGMLRASHAFSEVDESDWLAGTLDVSEEGHEREGVLVVSPVADAAPYSFIDEEDFLNG